MESWMVHRGTADNPTEQHTSQGAYHPPHLTDSDSKEFQTTALDTFPAID